MQINPTVVDTRLIKPGSSQPLGATWDGAGVNFALYSENATGVELCLFDEAGVETRIPLTHQTAFVWHAYVPGLTVGQRYGYRVHGPYDPERGLRFNPNVVLLDPYAKALSGVEDWDRGLFAYQLGHKLGDLAMNRHPALGAPLGVVIDPSFDWEGDASPNIPFHRSVLYEAHVKGLTMTHPEVQEELRGTYAAVASEPILRYLKDLGITAIELLPVHQHMDDKFLLDKGLNNYWGYSTLSFFAPDVRYRASRQLGGEVREFKEMVKALHRAGIEVILDVVYNHTAEGNHLGPTVSLKGIDNPTYYRLVTDSPRYYFDTTGTGNSLNVRHPQTLQLIMDSLRYWVQDMHVDGFRFDLAATLARELHEVDQLASFFTIIHQDPVISQVKLIAEPWDLGEGGYQVGNFPVKWTEWNGKYRDAMRGFWKGAGGMAAELGYRLTGSSDLYQGDGRKPYASINFVTAHDGFTLRDLVTYNHKHNEANLEGNHDGESHNDSWNCGVEGPTPDPAIRRLRARMQRNLLATLLLSQGTPMICGGDELGRTQQGNNNAYCQDNPLSWYDWDLGDEERSLHAFTRKLIRLRLSHPALHRAKFFQGRRIRGTDIHDIMWFRPDGKPMTDEDWANPITQSLGLFLAGEGIDDVDEHGVPLRDDNLLLLLNASRSDLMFKLPSCVPGWELLLDTSNDQAQEVRQAGEATLLPSRSLKLFRCPISDAHGIEEAPLTVPEALQYVPEVVQPLWEVRMPHEYQLGAHPTPAGTLFRVWTTTAQTVQVVLYDAAGQVVARHPLPEREPQLFEALVPGVGPGARYKFELDGTAYPDPYARYLPDGVHGPAMVWHNGYRFQHAAPELAMEQAVVYELHVGTFTPEGTFRAAADKLSHLKDLGVTALQLMPIAAFPGDRGWGYDGVAQFAPFAGYGKPEDLCALIDEAHRLGLAVLLDVVYNHFGPDGNYLYAYSPDYFTSKHKTPWGDSPDYTNPYMRHLVLDSALRWLTEFRFDGLRLDATHTIRDESPKPLLQELAEKVRELPGRHLLIAEDDRNEPGLVTETGLDGVWADDFHHQLRVLLTGEQDGYYAAYRPEVADLAHVIRRGWLYEGQPWTLTGKPRGKKANALKASSLVYCLQNHDQVGNRAMGDRLTASISVEQYRAASTLLLFLPMTPLLFMGQEWATRTPFAYFSDHQGELGEAVTRGRLSEFGHFEAFKAPEAQARIPDPQAESTFSASKLDWAEPAHEPHAGVLELYRGLLRLRREDPILSESTREGLEAGAIGQVLWVRRTRGDEERLLLVNFGPAIALDSLPVRGLLRLETLFASHAMPPGELAEHGALILGGASTRAKEPLATYRLQLHQGFDFQSAESVLDYLQSLGVTDVYTSPYLQAEEGSTHGYNVARHEVINPELGGEEGYLKLTDAIWRLGMGHLLDMVPNHMGITSAANVWWLDVLENGPSSLYADFFDIEWRTSCPGLQNKVLLPILGDQYGNVLERGELKLVRDGGQFWIQYWDRRFPVSPNSLIPLLAKVAEGVDLSETDDRLMELRSIINALGYLPLPDQASEGARVERAREKEIIKRRLHALATESEAIAQRLDAVVEAYNGVPGEAQTFDDLDALLLNQCYRLAFWRVATEEINYRRFFDINELAALRMEDSRVFEATHRLVLDFIAEGRITGLRLDHTDGLYDPLGYFRELQRQRMRQLTWDPATLEEFDRQLIELEGSELPKPLYVLAEKILEPGEHLPARWPIHGTTGYDFMAQVGGLWVNPKAERPMTTLYQRFTGEKESYEELLYLNKRLIMHGTLASEVNVLAHLLERLAQGNRRSRDFTFQSLKTVIEETIACFPVYRSYLREDGSREAHDDHYIEVAIRQAKRRNPGVNASIFHFLRDTLMLRFPDNATDAQKEEQARFVLKFQQVTSPVMAKGAEDTTFYNFNRLVSLNEVGSDPAHFGTSVAQFHVANQARWRDWPLSMTATSTHDTKRGEDTRARISVLSEMPDDWREYVTTWSRMAKAKKAEVDGEPAPSRNDEYLFYQSVVGAWPLDGNLEGFTDRLKAYMAKATKEAKRHTSWVNPNPEYDEALARFIDQMMGDRRFVRSVEDCHRILTPHGATNSLAQTLLKLTSPGVPDIYQGSELWNQSLVDPDNRRPVDYERRRALLQRLQDKVHAPQELVSELLERYDDGAVKLFVHHVGLMARQSHRELFVQGHYRPLWSDEHAVAFAREHEGKTFVTIVPRLTFTLSAGTPDWALDEAWGGRQVEAPAPGRYRNLLTGEVLEVADAFRLSEVFRSFPVALLERMD